LNNKKNSITNINFVYKKNINRPKISIKVMKNPKINPNIKTENGRKTLAHSSSTGYLQTFLNNNYTNNESNKNSDIDNNYFNIVNNDNWIHSPKRNHYKLFTENIKDVKPLLNRNPKNKIKEINIRAITNLNTFNDNNYINNTKNEQFKSKNNNKKK
jgi:hypothetical protein